MPNGCTCQGPTAGCDHTVSCPASQYQAGIQRGRKEGREAIVKWLRDTARHDNPWHLGDAADCIEQLAHLSGTGPK
jgi:hypothetical protein